MSTAIRKYEFAHIKEYTVESGQAATAGYPLVLASDTTVQNGGVSDLCIGLALNSAAAGARVSVALFGPAVAVPVGTGGATRGTKAVFSGSADGWTNAPAHDSDGTGNQSVYGIFLESGTAGQTVGMMLQASNRGS